NGGVHGPRGGDTLGSLPVGSDAALGDEMSTSAVSGPESASSTVVAGVELGDAELAATVRNGLEEVEKLLNAELSDGADFLQDAALHLANAGGKRFRPLFTI